jgi:hypothetical protein
MTEVRNADDQVIDILVAAGVRCSQWKLPAELLERPMGPPISHDDMLDFHETMSKDDWYTTLAAMTNL